MVVELKQDLSPGIVEARWGVYEYSYRFALLLYMFEIPLIRNLK